MQPRWLSVRDVAAQLGVSIWTVYRLVDAGVLPAVQWPRRGHLRIRPQDVRALLQPQEMRNPADRPGSATASNPEPVTGGGA